MRCFPGVRDGGPSCGLFRALRGCDRGGFVCVDLKICQPNLLSKIKVFLSKAWLRLILFRASQTGPERPNSLALRERIFSLRFISAMIANSAGSDKAEQFSHELIWQSEHGRAYRPKSC